MTKIAQSLNVHRSTIHHRLRELGLLSKNSEQEVIGGFRLAAYLTGKPLTELAPQFGVTVAAFEQAAHKQAKRIGMPYPARHKPKPHITTAERTRILEAFASGASAYAIAPAFNRAYDTIRRVKRQAKLS